MCSEPTRGADPYVAVRTGGGGLHVMFQNTPKIRSGKLDTGIDIRGRRRLHRRPDVPACERRTVTSGCRSARRADVQLAEPPDWLLTVITVTLALGRPTSIAEWRQIAGTRLTDGERSTRCSSA